ncbi:hypothetical protein V8C40DRAFT_269053 [Trichoderma camerunense]
MASKGKKKATLAKELFLTYTDLVKKEKSGERTQITEGHSAWADGIECIKAYHMQFTRLTPAQRDEMRAFIAGVHYAIPPSAKDSPSSRKLYKPQQKLIEKTPESLSWPVFAILRTIYKDTLPTKYVNAIRETFGTSVVADHSEEYYRLEGTLPAGPVEVTGSKKKTTKKKAEAEKELAEKKKRQLAMLEEMKSQEEGAREQEDREENIQSDDMQWGGLFGKTAQKRPASPTPLSREERRESGDDLFFSRVAGNILGNGSPAKKEIARSLLQGSQKGMGGRVRREKKNVAAKTYAAAEMRLEAAAEMKLATKLELGAVANMYTALKIKFKAQEKMEKAAEMELEITAILKAAAEESAGSESFKASGR